MDIFSFLLGIAGDVAKNWIIDLIRGGKAKSINEQQNKLIKELIAQELEKLEKTSNVSSDVLAKKVVEQIIVMAQNPDFPISVANGKVSLKESPRGKPFFGSSEKWAETEIAARLYKLDNVIRERYNEVSDINRVGEIKKDDRSSNKGMPIIPSSLSETLPSSRKHQQKESVQARSKLPLLEENGSPEAGNSWKQKFGSTAEQIKKRRENELKSILRNQDNDDDNNNTHS